MELPRNTALLLLFFIFQVFLSPEKELLPSSTVEYSRIWMLGDSLKKIQGYE